MTHRFLILLPLGRGIILYFGVNYKLILMSKSKERLNNLFFIICVIGAISSVYLVINSLINQDWGDALVGLTLGFACFANPLYEGIKRYKK